MNILKSRKISNNVFYIGANDRDLSIFEGMIKIPNKVAYNSYIIKGEKNICVDLTKDTVFGDFISKIYDVIGNSSIDYLIINHIEPDHSSGIKNFISVYPDVKIICNKKTKDLLKSYYNIYENIIEVEDGECINLGDKEFSFHLTPMVHWPESMVCYYKNESILFSQDIFGSFGALNGAVFDDEVEYEEDYLRDTQKYYINIVGKYSSHAINALGKLKDLDIKIICPTHGVVWRKNISKILEVYKDLAQQKTIDGMLIVYGSMYGNTKTMAEIIARGAAENGLKRIKMCDVSTEDVTNIVADAWLYKGIVLGAPTYDNDIFPPMANLLEYLKHQNMKNNYWAFFSNYSWKNKAKEVFNKFGLDNNLNVIDDSIEVRGYPDQNIQDCLYDLGENMASNILSCSGESCVNLNNYGNDSLGLDISYDVIKKLLHKDS